jgi:hypothetical protein
MHRCLKRHNHGGDFCKAKSYIFFYRHCKAPLHKQTFQTKNLKAKEKYLLKNLRNQIVALIFATDWLRKNKQL